MMAETNNAKKRDMHRNKPDFDPCGKYDYNKHAREQIDHVYEGESDTHWNTD